MVESKNKNYQVGDLVQGMLGWVTRTVVTDITTVKRVHQYAIDKPSSALGVLGMTG